MRDVKFRAWDKVSKKMRVVDSIAFETRQSIFSDGDSRLPKVINVWGRNCIEDKDIVVRRQSGEFELMQYTGLKDKNGSEIWESDIIKVRDPYNNCWSTDSAAVEFSTGYVGGWVISNGAQNLNLGSRQNHIEVIGNIHDNPELLEGGR